MTPERAGELGLIYANNYFRARMYEDATRLAVFVEQAILQACAEEREACAKICRSLHSGDAEFPDWSGGFQSGCEDCEEAIRGAK